MSSKVRFFSGEYALIAKITNKKSAFAVKNTIDIIRRNNYGKIYMSGLRIRA